MSNCLGYFEKWHILGKWNWCGYFLGIFCKNGATFYFDNWSHWMFYQSRNGRFTTTFLFTWKQERTRMSHCTSYGIILHLYPIKSFDLSHDEQFVDLNQHLESNWTFNLPTAVFQVLADFSAVLCNYGRGGSGRAARSRPKIEIGIF